MAPFIYFFLMVGLSAIILTPLFVNESAMACKIVFSVFSWVPYMIAGRKIYAGVLQDVLNHRQRDKSTTLLITIAVYMLVFMGSGGLIWMNYWLYAPDSWETLNDPNLTAAVVWMRFTASSILVATGGEFTALKPQWWYAEIVVAVMAFVYFVTFVIIVSALILPVVYDKLKDEAREEKGEESESDEPEKEPTHHSRKERKQTFTFLGGRNDSYMSVI